MSEHKLDFEDAAPGEADIGRDTRAYLLGLALAVLLTAASFYIGASDFIWRPAIPTALVVLAIGQIGIHLVFFLHITTSPDNTNNIIALAFGVFIVVLAVAGSIWIMSHMNTNMPPMDQLMQMQR